MSIKLDREKLRWVIGFFFHRREILFASKKDGSVPSRASLLRFNYWK